MDTTVFLAQLWGPAMLAVGLGFFFSRAYYRKLYRDLEKAPFAVLFFGMAAIAAGIAQIRLHDVWATMPQAFISLLGWLLLIKGVICTTFPRLADRGGDWALDAKLVPIAGTLLVLLGGYLSWVGFFA
jgi:hypothetical protein